MPSTLIRNARLMDGTSTDLLIDNGVFTTLAPSIDSDADAEIDAAGKLAFPGLIDGHTHMDKTLMGLPWHRHTTGPALLDKITAERELRTREGIDAHAQSTAHAHRAVIGGATHIRSFADVDTEWKLNGIHGLMQTRDELRELVTIQTVAFPQSGMLVRPGTVELLDQALADGADLIGGLDPSTIDRDPKGHLDTIFALADKHGVDIDIHLHEPGELGAFDLELIAERTEAMGYQGRVTISHAFCLGSVDAARHERLVELILRNNIAIMSHGPSGATTAPPVADLVRRGVRMACGNDGVQDAWGPLNPAEMLQRIYLLCYRNNWRRDDEIEMAIEICTTSNAGVLGERNYGIAEGCDADLVLVDDETHAAAVVHHPTPWLVMKRGRVTARDGALA